MDRMYILGVIERIEKERAVHDKKFKGNEHHANCLPRFDTTIEKLRLELDKFAERDAQRRGSDEAAAQ